MTYLDNKKIPKINEKVYALVGFENKIVNGKIVSVNNIDNKGLSNCYLDIDVSGKKYHVNISQIFNHKPKKVQIKDEYGFVTVWR